jgi:Obg family GTPase CgtA-like protein
VNEALAKAGAVAGDEVRIGDLTFEYTPDPGEE